MTRRSMLQMAGGAGAASLLGPGASAQAPAASRLPIGMNMAGIADWAPGFPFINAMWGARIWLTRNATRPGPFDTQLTDLMEMDENGYPLEVPFRPEGAQDAQLVFTILPNRLKPGRYVILYDGDGEFSAEQSTRVTSVRPGRIEIAMPHLGAEHYEFLVLRRSRRGNHVRNVRVVPIEHERTDLSANPFLPEAIEYARPWHCLRFMDWQQTNASLERKWSDRKRPGFYTQIGATGDPFGLFGPPVPEWQARWGSGIALEHIITYANLTKCDAWLCVPHLADDNYIASMAQLVKSHLDPSLKIYVEFSNEIWNWAFQQAQWMLRSELAGDLVVAAGGKQPWRAGRRPAAFKDGIVVKGEGDGSDHPERTGALFRRCFRIWEEVFGGADRKRIVRACAVQTGWGDTVERTLQWVVRNGGCDVLAAGGYFGPDDEIYKRWDAKGAALTADDVIADMRDSITRHARYLADNAAYARKAGVQLVVYEGGQHIEPQGHALKPYNPALGAAQKHPAMYDLYRRHLDAYAAAGCAMFCAFNSVGSQGTRHGSWGHIERYGQDPREMPKFRALLDSNTARSPR